MVHDELFLHLPLLESGNRQVAGKKSLPSTSFRRHGVHRQAAAALQERQGFGEMSRLAQFPVLFRLLHFIRLDRTFQN